MPVLIQRFCTDEDGAVTIDWVVMAALVLGLALAVTGAILPAAEGTANDVSNELASLVIDKTLGD
jgi:Flp pilus assembly pilin Flp